MKATFYRYGFHVVIEPDVSGVLASGLSYKKRIVEGRVVSFRTVRCYDNTLLHEGRPSVCIPAGLTVRALRILAERGIETELTDRREFVLPNPDLSRLDVPDDAQIDMLAAIIDSDHGIVEAPTGSGKSWIIRQICKIWPVNVLIVIPGKVGGELLRQTYLELLRCFPPSEVGMVGKGNRDSGKRITVVMDRSLHHANTRDCRILLFDEVHCAAALETARALATIRNARRFGFSASPFGRSDHADMETVSLFGEVIYSVGYREIQRMGRVVPIELRWVNTDRILPRDLSLFKGEGPHDRLRVDRHLVWRNDERNAVIAAAVNRVRDEVGRDAQVLIFTATVEHAVFLGKLLPDFVLVYGEMKNREKYERWGLIPPGAHPIGHDERTAYREDFRSGKLKLAIATHIWGTGIDFPSLQILVRADAQASPIASTQIPGRVTRCSSGKEKGIVIDFSDGFFSVLDDRARRRKSSYSSKGWTIIPS